MITYESHRSFSAYEIYKQYDNDLSFGIHLHNSFELIYVKSGEIVVTIDGIDYTVSAKQSVLIFPNRIHYYHTPKDSCTALYIFSNNFVKSFYQQIKNKDPITPIFNSLNEELLTELDNSEDNLYLNKSILYRIAYLFSSDTKLCERNTKSMDNYGKILMFISTHYAEGITAKDVARELGYDHRYITSLIKKGFNSTFRRLLNEYRISHAQYLLTNDSKSISQIAYECGYDSLCSFNRNFKEITHTTPKEFRQNPK